METKYLDGNRDYLYTEEKTRRRDSVRDPSLLGDIISARSPCYLSDIPYIQGRAISTYTKMNKKKHHLELDIIQT